MRRGVVGVVGLALLVAACAPAGSPIRVGPVASITAPAPAGRMTKLTDTTTAFAVALYNQLRTSDTSTNLAFSPFSVATVLAMIEQGARGPTAEQIRTALQAGDMTPAELAASFRAVMTDLDQAARTANIELDLANAVWVQTGLRLRPGFVETLKNDFASAPQLSDFRGNPEGARQAVNAWASAHTHQRIPELLPSGLVDRATRLILANAVYLHARWATPFASGATGPAVFHRLDGDVQAQFMHLREATLPALVTPDVDAVELPYVGGRLVADVIAPRTGSLTDFEQRLSAGTLHSIFDQLRPQVLNLAMPRFTVRFARRMDGALQAMGMTLPFTDAADFTGMTTDQSLKVQFVQHQAYLKVDEAGTEAAAATGGGMMATSARVPAPLSIRVDRPFLFLVRDAHTGAVLFASRVLDPTVDRA